MHHVKGPSTRAAKGATEETMPVLNVDTQQTTRKEARSGVGGGGRNLTQAEDTAPVKFPGRQECGSRKE